MLASKRVLAVTALAGLLTGAGVAAATSATPPVSAATAAPSAVPTAEVRGDDHGAGVGAVLHGGGGLPRVGGPLAGAGH